MFFAAAIGCAGRTITIWFIEVWHVTRADLPADKYSHRVKVMLASQMPVSGPLAEIQILVLPETVGMPSTASAL
jgi:hypothetical protein